LKRYDELAQVAADLQQKHPQSPSYHLDEIIGRGFKQQARFPEARQAFERVLADPQAFRTETAAKAQFLIGETYLLEEKWSDAFLAYQKVYASYAFPDWQAEALLQSGKCDEQQGQWAEAAKTYARLIEEFPQSSRIAEAKQRLEAARKRAAR
jgi:TolA-binding protein